MQELIGFIHDSCPGCAKYAWDLSNALYLEYIMANIVWITMMVMLMTDGDLNDNVASDTVVDHLPSSARLSVMSRISS